MSNAATEVIFEVQEALDGGFTAHGLGEPIFTEGDTLEELRRHTRDAVRCHYDAKHRPKIDPPPFRA